MSIDFEKVLKDKLHEDAFAFITSSEKEFADWVERVRWQAKRCDELAWELKRIKDKQEKGLLLELPCPRGTKVYFLNYEENDDFGEYTVCSGTFNYSWLDFPREFYLTRSEAEEALAKMNGEDA